MKHENDYLKWALVRHRLTIMIDYCNDLIATFEGMEFPPIYNGGTWNLKTEIENMKQELSDMNAIALENIGPAGDIE